MSIKKTTQTITLTMILAASLTSTIATAQQSGDRRGPPPEAIDACANQTAEASCSFSGRRGEVEGSCMVAPDDSQLLACMPAGGPPKHGNN